jgi:hypothetical protein
MANNTSIPLKDRFERKFSKTDGCWNWTGARAKNGYGQIGSGHRGGKTAYAHRVAYLLYVGEIPVGLDVCHTCDNPSCVRPDHLFLGTRADNMKDAREKGRTGRGAKNGAAKLKEGDVREIRRLRGSYSQAVLAEKFGVAKSTISAIQVRENWKHVSE